MAVTAAMAGGLVLPVEARTKKGDKFMTEGHLREQRKDWDAALEQYEKALAEDPSDAAYQLAVDRARFQAGAKHVTTGLKLRGQGSLDLAFVEFQRAYQIDPSNSQAVQELATTQQMIARERKLAEEKVQRSAAEKALTPAQEYKQELQKKINSMLPVPELKPLNPQLINLKMNNQPRRVLFETVAKLAGINALFDPNAQPGKPTSIELSNATLDQALDYLAVLTKSFWKPLSSNTIFVTDDNVTNRRDYEDQVMKIFYLRNVNTPQELQEIVTAVRAVCDIQRLFVYNAQNAIIARGEADRIALAEKIINDLDKPKSEVVVDVVVMEVSSDYSRQLAASLLPTGLNMPVAFTPRSSLALASNSTNTGGTGGTNTGGTGGTGTTPVAATAGAPIALDSIGKINTKDYSVVLPDGLLQAIMSNTGTRVLQAPELRSVDNVKASIKIGDREPTASGSFGSALGGVVGGGISPLVNTQFQYIDVGVNLDVTPRVHDSSDVSLHVVLEISKVTGQVNLGGINQPIIGQRKIDHEIRLRDGEVNLLGGLIQDQDTRTTTGVPGISKIPILGKLFSSETMDKSHSELLIALIPHIVRHSELSPENLRAVSVGNATVVKLNYGDLGQPAPAAAAPATPGAPSVPAAPGAAPQAPAAVVPVPGSPAGVVPGLPQAITGARPQTPAGAPGTPAVPAPAAPQAAPPKPAAPEAQPRVSFVPSRVDTSVNAISTVSLVLENAQNLADAPLHLKFDPKLIRINDITKGNLMGQDGQQVIFTKNIMNDSGDATINLSRMPNTGAINGTGTLVTISFQAIKAGTTALTIPDFAPKNAQGQALVTATPMLLVNIK